MAHCSERHGPVVCAGLLKAASEAAKSAQKQPAKAAAASSATSAVKGGKATAADKRAAASVKTRGRKSGKGNGRSLQEANLELDAPAPVDPHLDGPVFYRCMPPPLPPEGKIFLAGSTLTFCPAEAFTLRK